MEDLRAEQFIEFFKAVYGCGVDPFPWQQRLAQQVFSSGWPAALDIPTGAGKTAAIDIAVFHLALEAARQAQRRAAARILFVVDRRLIVDDAYARAEKIAKALHRSQVPILKTVGERLGLLSEQTSNPLSVVRLRGGMPKEPDWVRTPAQPTIVVSTVDQVGSRLLFRGYGVSDTMKPVHAGLIGADSLLLLDEAHLSQPFLQTVRDSIAFRDPPWAENGAPAPFGLVTLSATLSAGETASGEPFRISDQDRTHPQLSARLQAGKPAELMEEKSDAAMEERLAETAWKLREVNGPGTVVAVVVNRVKRARAIFDAIRKRGATPFEAKSDQDSPSEPQAALLIGRVRPLEREELTKALLPFIRADQPCRSLRTPLFLIATQCIEAGADLDFDALVTEIAPLDCLRQRFGRLNRMGRKIEARAAIVASADQVRKSSKDDPIYGGALKSTWNLLLEKSKGNGKKEGNRTIDFGVAASQSWFPEALNEHVAPRKDAPLLMPSAIELWRRTAPIPFADPEVSLYLHGPQGGPGDVEIVWRKDLDDTVRAHEKERVWTELVAVCPPTAAEAISVPIGEARNWLSGRAMGDIPDTELSPTQPSDTVGTRERALLWRGMEQSRLISAADLSPGDVILVPSSRGGCDSWGWNPAYRDEVSDLGREANREQRLRDILRLSRAELAEGEVEATREMIDWSDDDIADHFEAKFTDANARYVGRPKIVRSRDRRPLAVERRLRRDRDSSRGDAVTEDDASVRTGQRSVPLREHSKGVEVFARRFAEQAGLSAELIEDLALSGFLHDAGKAHPDFKRFLYGGDELAASGPDLAKSAKLPGTTTEWQDVRRRSGLPRRARHEIASLQLAQVHPRLAKAHDRDLVVWLVGTHHGYGRPFFPAPESDWPREGEMFEADLGDGSVRAAPAQTLADLTSRWFDLFERVNSRYGAWGLARLEAILRLADHRESEKEQEDE